jgi:hypothetical protein
MLIDFRLATEKDVLTMQWKLGPPDVRRKKAHIGEMGLTNLCLLIFFVAGNRTSVVSSSTETGNMAFGPKHQI